MKLAEQIEAYKKIHPNRLEHTFKNGVKIKAKLHDWLDYQYQLCVNEFKIYGTKNGANYLLNLLNYENRN